MRTYHHVDLPCPALAGSRCTHNPRAKFHALTRAGQKHLNKEAANCDARLQGDHARADDRGGVRWAASGAACESTVSRQ